MAAPPMMATPRRLKSGIIGPRRYRKGQLSVALRWPAGETSRARLNRSQSSCESALGRTPKPSGVAIDGGCPACSQ